MVIGLVAFASVAAACLAMGKTLESMSHCGNPCLWNWSTKCIKSMIHNRGRLFSSSADHPQLPRAVFDGVSLMALHQWSIFVSSISAAASGGTFASIWLKVCQFWGSCCCACVSRRQYWFQYLVSSWLTLHGSEVVVSCVSVTWVGK